MGNTTSVAMADSAVPMPPTACAIAKVWCSAWDAPRSQGLLRLSLDSVRPLLHIAASCVSVLLAHSAADSTDTTELTTQLTVSMQSLAAALSGDGAGDDLSDPVTDPSRFVRALVRTAFQRSEGDYLFGLTESRLDSLLEEHCCSQLRAVAALKSDPSALLEDALAAAANQIQQIIAKPPQPDDLPGIVNCLLLKQRLDCLARDAAELASEKVCASLTQQEAESGAYDENTPKTEEFILIEEPMGSSIAVDPMCAESTPSPSAKDKDEQQHGDLPMAMTGGEEAKNKDMDRPMVAAATAGDNQDQDQDAGLLLVGVDSKSQGPSRSVEELSSLPIETVVADVGSQHEVEETPPERTKSQMVKSIKVEKVKGNLDTLRGPVYDLRRATSALAKQDGSEEDDAEEGASERLKSELAAIDAAEKRARNFGEDLIEDMLTLDNLENLAHEDRLSRKVAYAGLESLLEDVDTVKCRLKPLRLSLEKRLKQAEERMHGGQQKGYSSEEEHEKENILAAQATAATGPKAASMSDTLEKMMPELPSTEAWRQMHLPLEFHSKQELDHYMIVAAVPNFDPAELEASLSKDMSRLTIRGLRAPSREELAKMKQHLFLQLQILAKRSPGQLKQLARRMGPKTYLELGEGKYGSFSQSLRLPEDVDVERINVGYEDGYLRIMLPKSRREARRARTARGLGSFNAPARGRFPSGMGLRQQRPWNMY